MIDNYTSTSSTISATTTTPGSRLLPYEISSHFFYLFCYLRYNLAIVGGGPAGTSIILRAMHLGFAHELLNGKCRKELDLEGNSAGVCIFDSGSKTRFGGGKLQDYKV